MKLKDLPDYCSNRNCKNCIYTTVCEKYFGDEYPLFLKDFVKDIDKEIEEDNENDI